MLNNVRNMLSGKKVYILGTLAVLTALVHYLTGDISLGQFLHTIDFSLFLNGSALIALRAAISKL